MSETTKTAVAATAPKAPKSFGVRLDGGAGELLWIRAFVTRTGWRSEAIVRKDKKNTRGATMEHPTSETARAMVDRLAAAAEKSGWKRRQSRGGGFTRRPDSFDATHLPRPSAKK